ncbi:MAG: M14 family metallopeptidase, partial [Holophaga sp.]|nr:M14 family metallopeptidase [Holophaga sp.]
FRSLLDRLVFLFLPVFNVDGHERFGPHNRINQNGPKEMGWRSNAAGLNLNRDYLKADAPEMRAWLKLHQAWLPDVFLDCHSTDGADYQYPLTIAREAGPGDTWFLEAGLGAWIRDSFLPGLRSGLEADGVPTTEYIAFRTWHDPRSGLVIGPSGPRYSQGYQSAQNRLGLLLETHMLKPYAVRVEATRLALLRTSELVARERDTVVRLNRAADAFTASAAFRAVPMPLGFRDDGTSEPMAFKGFAYERTTSDLTGGDWFTYDPSRPQTFQVPRYGHLKATASARVPEAYLVPPEWTEVIARIQAQGIPHHRLARPATLPVSGWRFRDVVFRRTPTEGRQRVESLVQEAFAGIREFPAGTVVVPTGNRLARIIVHLLEPASEESLLRWGFFNTIFEQKEYGESYVLEPLARKMLAADPALKAAYERRKAEDKAFAADPDAQLNWFYQRSPWGDPNLGVYPVGRVFDAVAAAKL